MKYHNRSFPNDRKYLRRQVIDLSKFGASITINHRRMAPFDDYYNEP